MTATDELRKLLDGFAEDLCTAGCGVKCDTREERVRLIDGVKDRYAQAIAATLETHEIIHCEDCENAHFFYPWRYPGERSTVEVGTCALMAEGVTIERDGYCAFAERREQ